MRAKLEPKSNNVQFTRYLISDKERAQLIDWVVMLHNQLEGLSQETLHITVNIIDRVL